MNAITVEAGGSLRYREVPDPVCGEGEALVEVHASALNRADLAQRAGKYPPPPGASEILGLELAGVLRRLPEGYSGAWVKGMAACALVPGGGYAELACVPTELLMPLPQGWTLEQAAALPEAYYTAFLNLFLEGALRAGERVLIHGGASGVGTAAIQLARSAGARVFATAGTPEKVALCTALGAEAAVNYREQDFAEVLRERAGEVELVLDMVGADYFGRNLDLLATGGRLVVIATLSGSRVELELRDLMSKRALVRGSTLRARPLVEKVALKEAFMARFWNDLEAGSMAPVIDSVYPIAQTEEAHARMRRNENLGKIVLSLR